VSAHPEIWPLSEGASDHSSHAHRSRRRSAADNRASRRSCLQVGEHVIYSGPCCLSTLHSAETANSRETPARGTANARSASVPISLLNTGKGYHNSERKPLPTQMLFFARNYAGRFRGRTLPNLVNHPLRRRPISVDPPRRSRTCARTGFGIASLVIIGESFRKDACPLFHGKSRGLVTKQDHDRLSHEMREICHIRIPSPRIRIRKHQGAD